MRNRRTGIVFGALLALSACSSGTFVSVTLDGEASGDIAYFDVGLTLGTNAAFVRIGEGKSPSLPTTATLEIKSGKGTLNANVTARDASDVALANGSGMVEVLTGKTVPLAITMISTGGGSDVDMSSSTPDMTVGTLSWSPNGFDYGTYCGTSANFTSTPRVFTLTNNTGMPQTITTTLGVSDFTFGTNGCAGTTLAAGESCNTTVTFTALADGTFVVPLTATGSAAPATSVDLRASAISEGDLAYVSPGTRSIGDVTVGSSMEIAAQIVLSNSQAVPANAISFMITGDDAAQFSVTSKMCGASLPAMTSCTFKVTFSPTSTGIKEVGLHINSSIAGVSIPIQGTGI